MTCPRCGRDFVGEDPDAVADDVVQHAHLEHRDNLDRDIALAHIEGVHPHDREGYSEPARSKPSDARLIRSQVLLPGGWHGPRGRSSIS